MAVANTTPPRETDSHLSAFGRFPSRSPRRPCVFAPCFSLRSTACLCTSFVVRSPHTVAQPRAQPSVCLLHSGVVCVLCVCVCVCCCPCQPFVCVCVPATMKVKSALRKICKSCKVVVRGKKKMVICAANPRHKQRQGFSTVACCSATRHACTASAAVPDVLGGLGARSLSTLVARPSVPAAAAGVGGGVAGGSAAATMLSRYAPCLLSSSVAVAAVAAAGRRAVHVEAKLAEMGVEVPPIVRPVANYTVVTAAGNMLYTAGHLPKPADGPMPAGKLGADFTTEEGYAFARQVGINLLATLKDELGDLDRVKQVVKLTVFVNNTDDFVEQPQVANGVSDLFGEVFGDRGVHSRSAVGTNALPLGVPVEIEAIVEVEP